MIVTSSYFDDQLLIQLTQHIGSGGYSGLMYNANLMLFTNNLLLLPANTFGDLTEANFSGYARKTAVTWSGGLLQPDGTYTMLSGIATFVASAMSAFTPNVIWGWALIDNANPPNLLMGEVFAQPIAIIAPNDGFGLAINFNIGPQNPASFGTVLA